MNFIINLKEILSPEMISLNFQTQLPVHRNKPEVVFLPEILRRNFWSRNDFREFPAQLKIETKIKLNTQLPVQKMISGNFRFI